MQFPPVAHVNITSSFSRQVFIPLFAYLTILLFAPLPQAKAAILIQYDFTGLILDNTILQTTTNDPNVSGSMITATGFGVQNTDWGGSESQANMYVRAPVTPGSLSSTDYFEFTLTPQPGVEMDLTSLTFSFVNQAGAGVGTFTTNSAIRSSLDFLTNIPSSPSSITITRSTAGTSTITATFDLSGAAYQNLTSPITFRQYIWDNTSNSAAITRVDTWTINGTATAVPEPSYISLFALGSAALILLRRRRDASTRR